MLTSRERKSFIFASVNCRLSGRIIMYMYVADDREKGYVTHAADSRVSTTSLKGNHFFLQELIFTFKIVLFVNLLVLLIFFIAIVKSLC
jgi:hypothetical protein